MPPGRLAVSRVLDLQPRALHAIRCGPVLGDNALQVPLANGPEQIPAASFLGFSPQKAARALPSAQAAAAGASCPSQHQFVELLGSEAGFGDLLCEKLSQLQQLLLRIAIRVEHEAANVG